MFPAAEVGSKVRTLAIAVANMAFLTIFSRLPSGMPVGFAVRSRVASASVGRVAAPMAAALRDATAAALPLGLGGFPSPPGWKVSMFINTLFSVLAIPILAMPTYPVRNPLGFSVPLPFPLGFPFGLPPLAFPPLALPPLELPPAPGLPVCIMGQSLPSLQVPRLWKGHAFRPLPASAELERCRSLPFPSLPFPRPGALGDVWFPVSPLLSASRILCCPVRLRCLLTASYKNS